MFWSSVGSPFSSVRSQQNSSSFPPTTYCVGLTAFWVFSFSIKLLAKLLRFPRLSSVPCEELRHIRCTQGSIPPAPSGSDISGLQAPAKSELSKIGKMDRQVDPPNAVIIPKMMIRVIPINAKRRCWLFQGRLGCDGAGTQQWHRCQNAGMSQAVDEQRLRLLGSARA